MMQRLSPALQAEATELSEALADLESARRLHAQGNAELEAGLATLGDRPERACGRDGSGRADGRGGGQPGTGHAGARQRHADRSSPRRWPRPRARRRLPPMRHRASRWPGRFRAEVVRRFNEPDAAGVRRPGLELRAPPLSLVQRAGRRDGALCRPVPRVWLRRWCSSPSRGRWWCWPDWPSSRCGPAMPVRRGEPLGLLGGRPLGVEEYVMLPSADTGAGGGETLYIEVRHGRGPVDPEPLFARKGIGTALDEEHLAGRDRRSGRRRCRQHPVRRADRGAGGREGEVGLRAARPVRRHLRADPHVLCRGGRRQGADRERDQRHADASRPAFELPAARRLRRHAGADQGRVRRARHRGHPGERLRQGGDADRGYPGRPRRGRSRAISSSRSTARA